jgi:hypothetical protein
MFESKSKIADVKQAANIEFSDNIKLWHEEYQAEQKQFEINFNFDSVEQLSINVWDELDSNNSTYIYVEMNEVPDKCCFDILINLYDYLKTSNVKDISVRFFDSTTIYPINLLSDTGRYTSFKRWELLLSNVDYETLNNVVGILKKAPSFKGKKFSVYSES